MPKKLPRAFSCIILACMYHPPGANSATMRDHVINGVDSMVRKHPDCGVLLTGDFNQIHWRKLFGRHINPQLFYQLYVDDVNQQNSVGGSCLVAISTLSCFYQLYVDDSNQQKIRWRKLSGRHPKSSTVLPGGHW